MLRHRGILGAWAIGAAFAGRAWSQPRSITRSEAVAAALAGGPRLAVGRADTVLASAQLHTARGLLNPTFTGEYTKSVPRYHATVEIPFDLPWIRGLRVESAQAARQAAQYQFEFLRAAVAFDADTTYTHVLAALSHSRLSRRTAEDADSLLRMAAVRRDAGDASDLDVELATVNAGQQANQAAADSLTVLATVIDLQLVMGVTEQGPVIAPADTLGPPSDSAVGIVGTPLSIAAAERSLASAELGAHLQRRSRFAQPSLTAGFETWDPGRGEPGILPTVGVVLPLPVLNRNRGPIAEADAQRARAEAQLALTRLEIAAQVSRAVREREIALAKVGRDRQLVASANRVAEMSLTAYREGAASLPNVLEAQRNVRETLGQYIDDLAAAWIANATVRLFTLSEPSR